MFAKLLCSLLLFTLLATLGGCADLKKTDPWEGYNRFMYKVDDKFDQYALKPASDAYTKVIPKQVRDGLFNGYSNLEYGNVILNDFLQGKLAQGSSDFGRMAVNSTLGIGGVFDIASTINLPAHQNDFGLTLGRWGLKPGPYLVLPLFGPSTLRDAPGIGVSIATNPLTYVDMTVGESIAVNVTEAIVMRASFEQEVRFRNEAAIDPYVFTRDAYLQYRENLVHEGKTLPPPKENIFDEDDTGPTTQPTTAPAPTAEPATTVPAKQPSITVPITP